MILKSFMTLDPITVGPDDSLYRAMQIMAWTVVRHLPVTVADRELVGILSERDVLALRASEPDLDWKSTPVSKAMRSRPQTAAPESYLTEAAARFAQSRIGCLPVTEKGKLVGLVTRTDVLAAEVQASMASVRTPLCAGDVMTRAPETVGPDEELDHAVELMTEMGIRHLPVIDGEGRAIGILDERNATGALRGSGRLTNWVAEGANSGALRVHEVMSKRPITIPQHESCASIADLFVQFRASAALVNDSEGALVGIVSYIDLLQCIRPEAAASDASPA